jgi:hypothetical protein
MLFAPLVILPACFRQERLVTRHALKYLAPLAIVQTYSGTVTLVLWLLILTFSARRIKVKSLPSLFLVFLCCTLSRFLLLLLGLD